MVRLSSSAPHPSLSLSEWEQLETGRIVIMGESRFTRSTPLPLSLSACVCVWSTLRESAWWVTCCKGVLTAASGHQWVLKKLSHTITATHAHPGQQSREVHAILWSVNTTQHSRYAKSIFTSHMSLYILDKILNTSF